MIDLRCEHCEPDEFGGHYCEIRRKNFGKCESCPFNTHLIEVGLEKGKR
jgi:hypothetical protein